MHLPMTPLMIVSAIAIGAVSAYLAHKRGRNPFIWFAVGFIFGIFGIFAIFFASPKTKAPPQPNVPAEPLLTIQGPADKFWYYLDPANQQQGPMSRDALSTAWKEGKINLTTYIWHEDLADWQLLKDALKAECGK